MTLRPPTGRAKPSLLLSIVIPVHNQSFFTNACLASLQRHTTDVAYEIIVVDDASDDDTAQVLSAWGERLPFFTVIRNQTAGGFATACNQGADAARGALLLLLNNDTEVQAGWFAPLMHCLVTNPDIGIVAPKLIFPDHTIQHCGKVWPDLATPLLQPQHIYYRFAADHPAVNKSRDYRMVTAACILVRTVEFKAVGGFDQGYLNGWEDDELCYRYLQAGKRVYYCAESTVVHHQSRTLSERIHDLESRLPSHEEYAALNARLEHNELSAAEAERALAILQDYQTLEKELKQVRERFDRNKALFFSRWSHMIAQDDIYYYQADGMCAGTADVAPSERGKPQVSIVIPLFNKAELTRHCLETLRKSTPEGSYELILVNNGSTDGTGALLAAQEHTVVVISNDHNLGFARACNQGAARARAPYVLFLNNDIEPLPGWLEPLVRVLDGDASVAAVGSKLLFPDRTIQHGGVCLVEDNIIPDPLLARHRHYGAPHDVPEANQAMSLQALTAACLLVRRERFVEVGGFDEGFWNGYEDVDLCLKLRQRGWKVVYEPASVLYHFESQSGPERFRRAQTNIVRLHEKWLRTVTPDMVVDSEGVCHETGTSGIGIYIPPAISEIPSSQTASQEQSMVSIIILTHNQCDYTRACVASIQKHTPEAHEILFVDNGSTDETVMWLRELVSNNPHYHLIENRENRGFAGGCNQGMAAARGNCLLLLNNDVIVTPQWLSGLLECLHRDPRIGIVGPMTNNINDVQRVPQVAYTTLDGLDSYAMSYREKYRHRRVPYKRVVGFCMLFPKNLYEQIGGLDERFGSGNFEDDDFCLRAALAGYEIVIAGDVFIHHFGSVTFKASNVSYDAAIAGNRKKFTEKWSEPVTDPGRAKKITLLRTMRKALPYFQRGEMQKAVDLVLQEGIRVDQHEPRYYLCLAQWLLRSSRYQDAWETLQEMPGHEQSSEACTLKGHCCIGLERIEEAGYWTAQALAAEPCSASATCLQGRVAHARGDKASAEQYYRRALEFDPGYGLAYTHLGSIQLEQGEVSQALDLLERGFLLAPEEPETARSYHAAIHAGRCWERGVVTFTEGVRFFPDHRQLRFLLTDLLIQQGQITEALEEVQAILLRFGVDAGVIQAGLSLRRQVGPRRIEMSGTRPGERVSLCMIMKNEEANLPRCLSSLLPIVDEMVLVDTGSSDLSREIAELFGARVFEYPWDGDFSAARNISLERAEGDWILVMDADETISVLDHEGFKKLVHFSQPRCAYDVETRNYMTTANKEKWRPNDGFYPEEAGMGWAPSAKVRIFPRMPGIRFEQPIHELVDRTVLAQGLTIETCSIPVHHYGYLDESKQQEKGERYYELGKRKLAESGGNDFRALCELAVQAAGTGRYAEAAELWHRVLAQDPAYPLAWFNLGYVYLQLNRFQESFAASNKALTLKPDYFEAVTNYCMAALCIGAESEMQSTLRAALLAEPLSPNLLVMQAVADICRGDREQGEEAFRQLALQGIGFTGFLNEAVEKLIVAGRDGFVAALLQVAVSGGYADERTRQIVGKLQT